MATKKTWRIAGINFDHLHMGDLLRQAVEHPNAEVVGVSHEDAAVVWPVIDRLKIPHETLYLYEVENANRPELVEVFKTPDNEPVVEVLA